jgi:lactoylglutathione lyase
MGTSYTAWLRTKKIEKPMVLHTMLRVKDFDATLRFYVDILGMKVFDKIEITERRATAMFVGFEGLEAGACLELIHPWDSKGAFTPGTGYGHVSVGVPDLLATFAKLESVGTEVIQSPGVVTEGAPFCAFVKDPDGYAVEIVQMGGA